MRMRGVRVREADHQHPVPHAARPGRRRWAREFTDQDTVEEPLLSEVRGHDADGPAQLTAHALRLAMAAARSR